MQSLKTEQTVIRDAGTKLGKGDILFCTSYIGQESHIKRYDQWIDYYLPRLDKLGCTKMMLIDDGSPLENVVKLQVPILEAENLPEDELPGKVNLIRFPDNLGRPVARMIPGWWRSFSFAALVALIFDAQRLIHIESDTYIFTDRVFKWLKSRSQYWASLWSHHYQWPETCVQVIPGINRQELLRFYHAGKDYWYGAKQSDFNYVPEYRLPIHEINKEFLGDRMGEDWCKRVPEGADFVSNMSDVSTGRRQHKSQEAKLKWLARKLEESIS